MRTIIDFTTLKIRSRVISILFYEDWNRLNKFKFE